MRVLLASAATFDPSVGDTYAVLAAGAAAHAGHALGYRGRRCRHTHAHAHSVPRISVMAMLARGGTQYTSTDAQRRQRWYLVHRRSDAQTIGRNLDMRDCSVELRHLDRRDTGQRRCVISISIGLIGVLVGVGGLLATLGWRLP
jgi:hypothetical protein